AFTGCEGIVGFRYVEYQERAQIGVDRGFLVASMTGFVDRTLQATYTSRVHNHMLMGQGGFEWNCPIFCWLSAGLIVKGAFGADDVDITKRLQRGDGLVRDEFRHNHWTPTSLTEINAFFDIVEFDKVHLRAGYA